MSGPVTPLPPDMRSGPIIVGVDDAALCGRPLRAAAFLARATAKEVLVVHVRRRNLPMVEGYVPVPEDIGANDLMEEALEAEIASTIKTSGDLNGVGWRLVSVTGDAAGELIRLAGENDAACVVVGKKHRGFFEFIHRISSGSVSRAVVSAQKFPVLVVP